MKYLNLSRLAAIAFLGLTALTACKNQIDCDHLLTGTPPLSISLAIRDRQNHDLLDYTTPGHYDTAQISQLNKGILTVRNNSGKAVLFFYPLQPGQITSYFKLSPTDQDTVLIGVEREQDPCAYVDRLKSFSYNGKVYTDSLSNSNLKYFIIVK